MWHSPHISICIEVTKAPATATAAAEARGVKRRRYVDTNRHTQARSHIHITPTYCTKDSSPSSIHTKFIHLTLYFSMYTRKPLSQSLADPKLSLCRPSSPSPSPVTSRSNGQEHGKSAKVGIQILFEGAVRPIVRVQVDGMVRMSIVARVSVGATCGLGFWPGHGIAMVRFG